MVSRLLLRLPPRRRAEQGNALLLALLVLVLVTTGALLVSSALMLRMREVQEEMIALRLTAMADAAVAETLAQLSKSKAFRGSDRSFGGGRISSELIASDGPKRSLLIEARYARRVRTVQLDVLLTRKGPRVVGWHPLAA